MTRTVLTPFEYRKLEEGDSLNRDITETFNWITTELSKYSPKVLAETQGYDFSSGKRRFLDLEKVSEEFRGTPLEKSGLGKILLKFGPQACQYSGDYWDYDYLTGFGEVLGDLVDGGVVKNILEKQKLLEPVTFKNAKFDRHQLYLSFPFLHPSFEEMNHEERHVFTKFSLRLVESILRVPCFYFGYSDLGNGLKGDSFKPILDESLILNTYAIPCSDPDVFVDKVQSIGRKALSTYFY